MVNNKWVKLIVLPGSVHLSSNSFQYNPDAHNTSRYIFA